MLPAVTVLSVLIPYSTLGSFLPGLPLDSLFSTQGIMVMLLAAYAVAMWMFLTSAPKVYTVMVSDLDVARHLYEGMLGLQAAEVPLHYYYNYEQTLGAAGVNPLYISAAPSMSSTKRLASDTEGLWYQLKKNAQLHVISGASIGTKNQQRHVCFDRECLEQVLMRVELRGLKHKVRNSKPLNFLVKDIEGRVIEMAEVNN